MVLISSENSTLNPRLGHVAIRAQLWCGIGNPAPKLSTFHKLSTFLQRIWREMASEPLAVALRPRQTLPEGLAPAGPLRDRQAEAARALKNATNKVLESHKRKALAVYTDEKRGAATTVYQEIAAGKPLSIVMKQPPACLVAVSVRQRRMAAASRWQKARKAGIITSAPKAATLTEDGSAPDGARYVKRGEFDHLKASYRPYTDAELLDLVYKVRDKRLKTTELRLNYANNKSRVPPAAVTKILYPKDGAVERIKALEEKGLPALGAPRAVRAHAPAFALDTHHPPSLITARSSLRSPRSPPPRPAPRSSQVLTKDQEDFALGLTVELALQRKPLCPAELDRWAALTAEKNCTRCGAQDMRRWRALFFARVKRKTGIDLEQVKAQQLSKARGGLMKSDFRTFEETVARLLASCPEVASRGLEATGDWDEMKLDLHKLLTDGDVLAPAGMPAYIEVDGERCEQITLLIGFMGYRDETHNKNNRFRSLNQIKEVIQNDNSLNIGDVAGYPKLRAGFWDDDDFMVLPGLLVFKGAAGADPAWLDLVHDKTRLMVACTESGYVTTELKYEWYRRCKELKDCPFGKRPTIPQCDSHSSNESVEMSAEMELEDDAHLISPPSHSTHATQQLDQTGGPIQNLKRVAGNLFRHTWRLNGKRLTKALVGQVVEQAIALSFTPAICSYSTRRVGWSEDENGCLVYSPLSLPHIVAQLVDDEEKEGSHAAPAQPPAVAHVAVTTDGPRDLMRGTTTPAASTALAAFRSGQMDGAPGITAGKEAALAILGRGGREGDGFDHAEDMEEEVIGEEGSRGRRRHTRAGRILGAAEFRESKESTERSAVEADAAEKIKGFKKRRLSERVLNESAEAEDKLAKGVKVSQALLQSFVRARTNEPVKEKGTDLEKKVDELRGKPYAVRLGVEPDGYQGWLATQAKDTAEGPGASALAVVQGVIEEA